MIGIKNSDFNLLDSLFAKDEQTLGLYTGGKELNEDVRLQIPHYDQLEGTKEIDIIISEEKIDLPGYENFSYWYFNNPDGTMRWVYPSSLKKPMFLAFYNSNYYKAKLIKMAFKGAFMFGMQSKLSSGAFHVYSKSITRLHEAVNGKAYSIFTGTVGSSRKFVIETHQGNTIDAFIKMSITKESEKYIMGELSRLNQLSGMNGDQLVIPQATKLGEGLVRLSNVKPKQHFPTNDFTTKHAQSLVQMYQSSLSNKNIDETSIWKRINENASLLNSFEQPDKLEYSAKTIELLQSFKEQIDPQITIQTAIAHNDFTPWNAYVGKKALHVYDWEMALNDGPLFLDVFHFIFQSNVLLKHNGFEEIVEEIKSSMQMPELTSYEANKEWQLYLKLYLLDNVTYYLNRYLRQDQLHMQANWLIKVWHDALVWLKENA